MQNDPEYRKHVENHQRALKEMRDEGRKNPSCAAGPVIVPVAVHFDAGVVPAGQEACAIAIAQEHLAVINAEFAGLDPDAGNFSNFSCFGTTVGESCLEFCLATENHPTGYGLTNGNPAVTFGQINFNNTAGGGSGVPKDVNWAGYLNIFVDNLGGGLLGEAAGIPGDFSGEGVIVDDCTFGSGNETTCSGMNSTATSSCASVYDEGETLTHEIGHYMGLFHIWGDNSGCTGAQDQVADTPNMDDSYSGYTGCGSHTQCSQLPTSCSSEDMYMNFMSYASDGCMYMFTSDQADVMYTFATNSGFDENTPSVCTPSAPVAPVANFTPANGTSFSGCTGGGSIAFTDTSTGIPTSWSWTFSGAGVSPTTSSAANPVVTVATTGTLTATLTASNGVGSDSKTHTYPVNITNCSVNSYCDSPNVAIPDNNTGGVSSDIVIGASGTISDVNLDLDITHTYIGDLTISVSFNGTTVLLADPANTCSSNNITNVTFDDASSNGAFSANTCTGGTNDSPAYTGTYNAENPLSVFNGMNQAGTWTITVVDGANQDTGTLDDWCLEITSTGTTPSPPVAAFTTSSGNVCEYGCIRFTDNSTNSPNAWSWTFSVTSGDITLNNLSSTDQNPLICPVLGTSGTIQADLTVSNNDGSDNTTSSLTVIIDNTCVIGCFSYLNVDVANDALKVYTAAEVETGATGFVAGSNSFDDESKAEFYDLAAEGMCYPSQLTGVNIYFGGQDGSPTGTLAVNVWDNTGTDGNGNAGAPGAIIGTTTINVSDIVTDITNNELTFVDFSSAPITINGPFYVGVKGFNTTLTGGNLGLVTNTDPETNPTTAWEEWSDGNWYPFDDGTGSDATWEINVGQVIIPFILPEEPTASFSIPTGDICDDGTSYTFTNTSNTTMCSGTTAAYEWTLTDAGGTVLGTATTANTTASFNQVGTYNLEMCIIGSRCETDCTTLPITVTTCGTSCYSLLDNSNGLSATETGVADYESSDWISTSAPITIQNGASVDYDATNYVQLNAGFVVEQGAVFMAFIDGCDMGGGGANLQGGNPNNSLLINQIKEIEVIKGDENEKSCKECNLGQQLIQRLKKQAVKQIEIAENKKG